MKKTLAAALSAIFMCMIFAVCTFVSYAATALQITKQPTSVSVYSGETAKVSVTAKGDKLSYKWYYKDTNASKYTLAKSEKSKTYSVKMTSKLNGRKVYCIVKDKNGKTVKSKVVTLKMSTPPSITKQPSTIKVFSGEKAKVTIKAKGDGLTYEWYVKKPSGKKYTVDSSSKSTSFSLKMTKKLDGTKVYCVVKDKNGKTVKSKTVTLGITDLKITTQPSSMKIAADKTGKLTLKAKGEGLKYKWYYKNPSAKKYTAASEKTSSYSVKMNNSRDGMKVYCVVTDKYGNKLQSKTVTLTKAPVVKITKQPASASVNCSASATVSVTATGDDLTYSWFYKDAGAKSFTNDKNAKGNSYSVKVTPAVSGRSVYCVITDKYGASVQSSTVTLSSKHVLDNGKITTQATCAATGVKVFTCKYCSYTEKETIAKTTKHSLDNGKITVKATCTSTGVKVFSCKNCSYTKKETIAKTAHVMDSWKTYIEATVTETGIDRRYCKNCSYYNDRTTEKLKAVYYITVKDAADKTYTVGVAENGKYTLEQPTRVGYNFTGWKTEAGDAFAASGVYKANITIKATWELDGTDTLAELVERTDAGVDRIVITSDITVDTPLYIYGETTVYADADHKLIRKAGYDGDIFIVGRNRDGDIASVNQKKAILNLGGGKGTLTIDGNSESTTVTVVGSLVYAADSSFVNLYDGAVLTNNTKNGNRTAMVDESAGKGTLEKTGGAGIAISNSTVTMYGGEISNCKVNTEYTKVTLEDGTEESYEIAACGGAVYNRGNFKMYGGKITGNEALRGGGIYTASVAYIEGGEISDNIATVFGGGLASSSSMGADIYIGTESGTTEVLFKGNQCLSQGGALYSNTSSPITIYGNAKFENNSASSGGAIHTAGPLEIIDADFIGNSATASGGAIYHSYVKATFERRDMRLTGCNFENNSGKLGGAIILSASDSVAETEMGTYGEITDCTFKGNKTIDSGNGGAIYITRKSDAIVTDCKFENNISTGNGGAMAVQSGAKAILTDIEIKGNSAKNGGGIYSQSDASLALKNVKFDSNSSTTNGGAVYFDKIDVTFDNVDFTNNTAGNHAGAVYLNGCDLTVNSSCEFTGNKAAMHGGAFYLTYTTISETEKDGAVLTANNVTFKNNSAVAGGAISARTACEAILDNVIFEGNTVSGYESGDAANGDADGGAAIYVGYGKLTLKNVTATKNESEFYGGVISSINSVIDINGGSFSENKAATGGVISAARPDSTQPASITIKDATFTKNESTYVQTGDYNSAKGGGVIRVKGGTLDISNSTFDGNTSAYYGGVILASGVTATINENTKIKNSGGATGAAVHFTGNSDITMTDVSVTDNKSSANGVLYFNGGEAKLTNVSATGNEASNGGVIYSSNASTDITLTTCTLTGNTARSNGGAAFTERATLNLKDCDIKENKATNGGAIFSKLGIINSEKTEYIKNEAITDAKSNGGAIFLQGATLNITAEDIFSENKASNHAGAVYVSYFDETVDSKTTRHGGALTATGGTFTKNEAIAGGAISIRSDSEATLDSTAFTSNVAKSYEVAPDEKSDGDNEGGGAIYAGYGKLTLKDVTATENTAYEFGGVISAPGADITISGGTFSGNSSKTGAVIRALNGTSLTITNGSYTDNVASNEGGAISYIGYGNPQLTITGATFERNSSTNTGGALYIYKAKATLDTVKMLSNSSSASNGGAINVNGSEVEIKGASEFKNNTAKGHGAAIYVTYVGDSKGNVTMTDGTISDNTAMSGAALSVRSNCVATLTDTVVSNNSVSGSNDDKAADGDQDGGGAFYEGYGTLNLNNVTVTKNSSEFFGGAISAAGGTVNVNGGTFSENTATTAGAINAIAGAQINIDGTTFDKNTASVAGAINSSGSSKINIKNATFTANESTYVQSGDYIAANGGGAIKTNKGTLDISGSTFDGNKSGYYGGTINAANTTINIKENSVFKNSVGGTGATLYIYSGSKVTISDTKFTANKATANGNIYFNACEVNLDSVIAYGNNAANGAVIYTSGISTVITADNCNFYENTATGNGGAIYAEKATVNLNDCELDKNSGKYGGAFYVTSATVNINDSEFDGNNAVSNEGGAIYITRYTEKEENATPVAPKVTITSTDFANNTSKDYGGAISTTATAVSDLVLKVTGCNFTSNSSSTKGGAVSLKHGNSTAADPEKIDVVFTNCKFEKNTAKGTGGAIELRSSVCAKFDGLTANNNSSADTSNGGGVIYVTSNYSRLYLTGEIVLSGNEAKYGKFISLYNSNYSNPPKIYTTYSEAEATWNTSELIRGNGTSIQFGMTSMP